MAYFSHSMLHILALRLRNVGINAKVIGNSDDEDIAGIIGDEHNPFSLTATGVLLDTSGPHAVSHFDFAAAGISLPDEVCYLIVNVLVGIKTRTALREAVNRIGVTPGDDTIRLSVLTDKDVSALDINLTRIEAASLAKALKESVRRMNNKKKGVH